MKTPLMLAVLMATAGLVACERPTVVNTPPAPVAVPTPVPGPPGPPGETGKTGTPGDTTVLVVPPPAASASEPK
jgi:hypothetical protein